MKFLKILLPILVPAILIFLCFIPDKSETQNQLLNVVAAIGTLGALLFLILDKFEKEKEEKEKFWHEHLPYLTIGSPCDPTQNRCDINLLTNLDDSTNNRGCRFFSISNFSTANAYNLTIELSTSLDFENNPGRNHYIDLVPITQFSVGNGFIENVHYIYSKYHINPNTKEVKLDEFDLCNFTNNCDTKRDLKTIFIRLEYFSTPLISISKKIISVFKVDLECGVEEMFIPPEVKSAKVTPQRKIIINNILRIEYHTKL